jgi:hypothetical protein
MADVAALNAAAQRKRVAALGRATAKLNELADQGAAITFQRVAGRAGVSRQWLYRQPELRAQIEELRQRPSGAPIRQRTSEASLQQRLRTVLDDNQILRQENRDLKHELALAHGEQRTPAPSPAIKPRAHAASLPDRLS